MRIVCQQLAPVIGDLEGNRTLAREAIRRAVDAGADIVVLPELVTSGYVFASAAEAASLAVAADHQIFREWAAEAARAPRGEGLVVGGFCEQGEDGQLYNSAAVVAASGVVAVYRKLHLWDREKLFFRPGDALPPVLDTPHGKVGVLVCYDLEFAELTRTLALRGAELLVVPTNWPLVRRPGGEHPPEVIMAMAAARANRMAVACCDRSGVERGQAWTEGTTIVDQDGWIVAGAEGGSATAELDLERSRDKRLTELADLHGDRRPELYGELITAPVTDAAR